MTLRATRAWRATRRGLWFTLALLAGPAATSRAATIEQADSAFAAGRYDAARIRYDEVLAEDPYSVRALFRRAVLSSWDNQLDSALVFVRRARALDPYDMDLLTAEAQFLMWSGDYAESVARYDSVLTTDPERRDALLGRAQALSWRGSYAQADSGYRRVLAHDPGDADAWVGLARIEHWQGDDHGARARLERALALDPDHRGARALQSAIDAAHGPRIEPSAGVTGDSDRNTSWWQTVATSMDVDGTTRGFASLELVQVQDPTRRGAGRSLEAGVSFTRPGLALTGALGGSVLEPSGGSERSTLTGRAALGGALGARGNGRLEYARYPFDETAQLLERGLDAQSLAADLDVSLLSRVRLDAGGSVLGLTDGNRRAAGILALTASVGPHLTVGAFGRLLRWEERGPSYFSPERFAVLEARATGVARYRRWEGRLGAGLGGQRIASSPTQSEWHLEARIGRRWSDGGRMELLGGATNSAEVSNTGAYRSYNVGVSVLISL